LIKKGPHVYYPCYKYKLWRQRYLENKPKQ